MPFPRVCLWAIIATSIVLISTQLWHSYFGLIDHTIRVLIPNSRPQNLPYAPCAEDYLYPIYNGEPTLKCGIHCYKFDPFTCTNILTINPPCSNESRVVTSKYGAESTILSMSDPPYANYFYSDCNVVAQVVVTSPLPDSDLSVIGPRLIVAWPAGNSGICLFFRPDNGKNGSLTIEVLNSTIGSPLAPVYIMQDELPSVGIKGIIRFNTKAVLSLSILGSIRAIRDFTEGPSLLYSMLQEGIRIKPFGVHGVSISRLWLDNKTMTVVEFLPGSSGKVSIDDQKAIFEAGEYLVSARYNYPQLDQLSPEDVLREKYLIQEQERETKALSFLSYSDKILAGAWRFLTYFGRDDMIATLLLSPILSDDAIEAVIGSVLERVNRADGSACHEETIGEYAMYMNLNEGLEATNYRCDYGMVDTEYFLPILMHAHFAESGASSDRLEALLATSAGLVDSRNLGLTWGDLFLVLAKKIMDQSAPFASAGGQTQENLIHLREDHVTGQWRDSVYGIGGGRIPFDVNVALAPAALRSIASLARKFGSSAVGGYATSWSSLADQYAKVWEDHTLDFFQIVLPADIARQRLETFVKTSAYYSGPSYAELVDSEISYYGLALEANDGIDVLPVIHTDVCFRLLFLNDTNSARLTSYLNATALSILRPFPAGLTTPFGLVVANPAFSEHEIVRQNFSTSAYHGTVIWSWQLAAMAKGLEKQLGRCSSTKEKHVPDFCNDHVVYKNVKDAYNVLWDGIEQNKQHLSDEVWSWVYKDGQFVYAPLGSLPAQQGAGVAESDIIQLWSLTFLAVKRNEEMR